MAKDANGSHFSNQDRERIIKMDVKVDRLILDVAEINKNYGTRIAAVEVEKLDKIEADKMIAEAIKDTELKAKLLEDKLSRVEKIVYGCAGTILLGVIGAILSMVIKN